MFEYESGNLIKLCLLNSICKYINKCVLAGVTLSAKNDVESLGNGTDDISLSSIIVATGKMQMFGSTDGYIADATVHPNSNLKP